MRLHTIIIALFVLSARAATIADKTEVEFEKKLQDVVKEVIRKDEVVVENVPSEKESVDPTPCVKDVENNLRKTVQLTAIPVKVVTEDIKPSIKSDNEKNNESNNEVVPESEDNIKRVEVDLRNPGPPQRQEHETQNPEHFEDNKHTLSFYLKQNIIETQNVFNNGVKSFQKDLQNWWNDNQQYAQIQQNIRELQNNFQSQIDKLNDTVQNYWPADSNPHQSPVESGLKMLESNLKAGVKSLAKGVEAFASGKGEESESSTSIPPFGQGPFAAYFQQLQQQIQLGFQNMTNTFQSYYNQSQVASSSNNSGPTNIFQNLSQGVQSFITQQGSNQSANAQADENGSTSRPSIWQSFQNLLNPQGSQANPGAQQDTPQPATPNRPIIQAIQNNPIYQSVASVFQPNKPAANKPEDPKPEATKPEADKPETQEGYNSVPDPKPEADQQKEKPQSITYAQSNPIKQMLIEKNPIVQGIAGAVQRIQHTITNPEEPREKDVVKDGEKDHEKGILLLGAHGHKPGNHHHGGGGHGGGGGAGNVASIQSSADDSRRFAELESGNSNNHDDKKEDQPIEPEKQMKEDKKEEVPDKTE